MQISFAHPFVFASVIPTLAILTTLHVGNLSNFFTKLILILLIKVRSEKFGQLFFLHLLQLRRLLIMEAKLLWTQIRQLLYAVPLSL